MSKKWNTVDLLRHDRHDWLNHLQIIKGYLSLGKVDQAKDTIDEIVRRTSHEAKLSNLNIKNVAEQLLTFNWQRNTFCLDFEVMGDTQDLSAYDEVLQSFLTTFTAELSASCVESGDNHLLVTLQLLPAEQRLILDFQGKLSKLEPLLVLLEHIKKEGSAFELVEDVTETNEVVWTLKLCERE